MQKKIYDLKVILETLFSYKNNKVKKRLIYDKAPLGGLSNFWTKLTFILLPIVMYAAIFNKASFAYLGIAQAIVAYIILLVFAMQLVVALAYFNNRKILKTIEPSWKHYFPNADLKMVLSSGVTPYMDFMKHYELTLNENLDSDGMYTKLQEAFLIMEEENKDLIDAINKDKAKQGK
jgi:hypothetical protein